MDSRRAETEGEPTLHSLVLAAGASTRFGSPKQLVRLDGRPLLHRTVSSAAAITGQAVTVVLGAHAAELAPLLRHSSASVVVNREWAEGIGSSIRAGIAQLPASCDAVLVLLADQAAVSVADLERLRAVWRREPLRIAASRYESVLGVPAIFPRSEFRELASLHGDRGARGLIRRRAPHLNVVELASAAIDIDTPEDLLRLTPEPPR